MKRIAIIGCGWLGLPLAEKLIQNEYAVIGTTTSEEKLSNLKTRGIEAHILNLDNTHYETSFLNSCDTLFLNIPPGLRNNPSGSFMKKLEGFLEKISDYNIKKLVYINSTAVYPNSGVFDETTPFNTESEKGIELLASEDLIAKKYQNICTLRLGGLFGPSRHPSKFVRSAQQLVSNSTANLIHLEDAVNLSYLALTQNLPRIINGVHPHHPDKYSFYKKAHESENKEFPYPKPTAFTERIIDMKSSISGFNFKNESLFDYL